MKWTSFIDNYVPIIKWLTQYTDLKGKLPIPILTSSNAYKCEDDIGIYQLFEYINGNTIGNHPLNAVQINQLTEIITELHRYGGDIPFDTAVFNLYSPL